MQRQRLIIATALFCLLPSGAHGQVVHGTVTDPGGRPIPGVVLLLLDSSSADGARALSNAAGEFRLTADHAGTFRIRTLHIGYRPTLSAPLVLRAGEDVRRSIVIVGVGIRRW